jgi:hypothetical protein
VKKTALIFCGQQIFPFLVLHVLLSVLCILDTFLEFKHSFEVKEHQKDALFSIWKPQNAFFLGFWKSLFLAQIIAESPPSLRHGTSNRTQSFFLQVLDSVLGPWFLFFFKNIAPLIFGSFCKKTCFFVDALSILVFLCEP